MARQQTLREASRWPAALACAAALAACRLGPDYQVPAVTAPGQWQQPTPPSEGRSIARLPQWWRGFKDPRLDRLVARALKRNPDLAAAEFRVKAARTEVAAADAKLWPTLDAGGGYQRELISENALLGVFGSIVNQPENAGTGENQASSGLLSPFGPVGKPFDLFLAGFDSAWELDLFGGIARRVEAAEANSAAALAERGDLEITLAAEVARLYLEIVALECRARIAEARLKDQQEAARLAERSYAVGFVSPLEVQQARDKLDQDRAVPPVLRSQLEQHRHALALLLGLRPGELDRELSGTVPTIPEPPAIPVGLPADLLRRRPDIRRAERRVAAASSLVGAALAETFPKLSLTGAAGFQSQELSNFVNPSSGFYGFGPRVSLPIFQGGRLKAQVEAREAQLEEAGRRYEKAVLNGFREVEDELSALRGEKERLAAETRASREAEAASRGVEAYYREGEVELKMVLETRRAWHDAEDRAALSRLRWAAGHVALVKALGGGWREAARRE